MNAFFVVLDLLLIAYMCESWPIKGMTTMLGPIPYNFKDSDISAVVIIPDRGSGKRSFIGMVSYPWSHCNIFSVICHDVACCCLKFIRKIRVMVCHDIRNPGI